MAKQTLIRAYRYSWQHRRQKKRVMRRLWIARINAALRVKNISYSKFINLIKSKQISLNRKVLADMATSHPQAFYSLLDKLISS
jgi:large subunit ribosomal protein L20